MNKLDKCKIAYFCHGIAGLKGIQVLDESLKDLPKQVFVVTYKNEANEELIQKLKDKNIQHFFYDDNKEKVVDEICDFEPDLILSIHFRHKIPVEILSSAKKGGINLHPSLLPKYRGAFSVPWVIINQEKKTGITYHFMNENFDDGKILLQKEWILHGDETAHALFHDLIDFGIAHLKKVLELVFNDNYKGYKQEGEPTYYTRKLPHSGIIDPNWEEEKIDAFIRAMYFPPHEGAKLETTEGFVEILSMEDYYKRTGEKC